MVFNDLLDLRLDLGGDLTLGDLLEERAVGGGEVRTELTFPAGDLVDGDGVELYGAALVRNYFMKGELHIPDRLLRRR